MNKYKFFYNDIEHELTIEEIFKVIKSNPGNAYYKIINNTMILINYKIVCGTQFICHRINSINELSHISQLFGTEIDIRDDHKTGQLILSHDPFVDGEYFENYLQNYHHNTLILNIKSERTELECIKLMEKYNITNYFFLDSSFPMIYLLNTKYNNNKFALRYSEYETIDQLKYIHDIIQWIWIDCFTKLPIDNNIQKQIEQYNKKICIVSPELQNQHEKIKLYKCQLEQLKIIPDAICCKECNIIEWI